MTIVVYWDIKPQTKQKSLIAACIADFTTDLHVFVSQWWTVVSFHSEHSRCGPGRPDMMCKELTVNDCLTVIPYTSY